MTKTIAVLMGGWSLEREVSLTSGKAVSKILKEAGYNVKDIDVSKDIQTLIQSLSPKPDVVFNALHGTGGEDGTIQAILEMLEIPYTHSNVAASALAMDKVLTRNLAKSLNIPVAEGFTIDTTSLLTKHPMTPPYIVKPIADGSTFGLKVILSDEDKFTPQDLIPLGKKALVEKFIPGRELTVGLIGGKALAVTEIIYEGKSHFDFEAKYTKGFARHELPANIPQHIADTLLSLSEKIYSEIGCNGIARCDFRYNPDDKSSDGIYFLEINSQPGFTPISLLPEQAESIGKSFLDVINYLIENPISQ